MLTDASASLSGQAAIVTGAARGLGRAIALGLAAYGADVAVCDRDERGLRGTVTDLESLGRHTVSAVLDVRDRDRVLEFCDATRDAFETIDILVNNAGGTFRAPFTNLSVKGRHALIAENFTSAVDFIQAVLPVMPDGGSIVNV